MANYISNAFSVNMFSSIIEEEERRVNERNKKFPEFEPEKGVVYPVLTIVSEKDVPSDVISGIGHQDTARLLSKILGFEVPQNRISIDLKEGDRLFVAQYFGERLPEGCTELPKGSKFKFFEVHVGITVPAEVCPGGVCVF